MSNLLYMDDSNGNGVYATKPNNAICHTNMATSTTTATPTPAPKAIAAAATANNLSNNINTTATTAVVATLPTSVSNEDLSQSLSEYTDADESISAPTEFLAEFLSAVMLKDYKKALKYCKLILQYEPNNSTAKEFYPLILDKLRVTTSSDSDENYNKSSSPELVLELQCSDPSAGESDEVGSDEQQLGVDIVDYMADDYGAPEDNSSGEPHSNGTTSSSNNCSERLSLSESDDEEEEIGGEEEDEDDDVMSSSGDDLPIDEQQDMPQAAHINHVTNNDGSGSQSSRNSSSGGGGRSRSDNTTHSYSSLLLEEEYDMMPANSQFTSDTTATDLDVSNGNKIPSASCSDSESPTEPLTQRLAAILLSKCGVSSNNNANY